MKIKERVKVSRTRTAPKTANNKTSPIKSKIEAAVAKMLKKVIPKNKVLKDKSRYNDSPPGGEELAEGRILVQSLTPEGESAKRPIKSNIGGTKAQSKRWKMMAKMRSRRNTLDW